MRIRDWISDVCSSDLQRPVDRAFAGLRPLADRIGSLSARMALWFWADDLRAMLGERVFEPYPAPIVHRLLDPKGRWGRPPAYKGRSEICWGLGRWQAKPDERRVGQGWGRKG